MRRIVGGVCASMGADFELTYSPGYPVTVNDAAAAALVKKCAERVVGAEHIVTPLKTTGGEDFAFFLQKAPGCYFALGAGYEGCAGVHNPEFRFNEEILLTGVETYCNIAMEINGV
jgi:amidohydrolase